MTAIMGVLASTWLPRVGGGGSAGLRCEERHDDDQARFDPDRFEDACCLPLHHADDDARDSDCCRLGEGAGRFGGSRDSAAVTFDAAAQAKVGLNPTGEHVATSADPGALWGAEKRSPVNTELRAAMTEFRKLSPDAQQARIAKLKTKQAAISRSKVRRACIDQLDARYKTMLNTSKGEMLQPSNKTDAMSPAEKQHLDGLLNKADVIAKEIEGLKAKAATMPDSKVATPEQKEERTALARQIKNARSRLSTATKAATTYVDSLGLKAERVAVNEQDLDLTAPPPSSPKSPPTMASGSTSTS